MTDVTKDDQTPTSVSSGASSNALLKKRYLFIIENDAGEQLGMTEKWDFDSIIREVNGTATVTITTDKTIDSFNDTTTSLNNSIKIRVATDTTGTDGLDYFSGYIMQRTLVVNKGIEKVVIRCFGNISKLYQSIWRDGTTIVHDYSAGDTASNIIKEIIDNYRTLDSNMRVNYSTTSVENSGTTVKDIFEAETFGDGLDKVAKLAYTADRIWYWRVMGDDVFTFKKAAIGADHQFIMNRDIVNITLQEDLINSANEIFTYYNNTDTRRVSDSSNITSYGYISDFGKEANAADTNTADEIGNALLVAKTPPLLKFTIVISDKYTSGIETINPGDTCEILNVPESIRSMLSSNMLITKTIYTKDQVELELTIKHPLLESELERLRKEFHTSQTNNLASTTYTDV